MHEHYPEEYIKGKVRFFGRDFIVTPDVLIPRLETEGLVRRAREVLKKENITTLVDIGTGSGIIGISLADLIEHIIFLDISLEALNVAKRNFEMLYPAKEADFIVSDLLSGISGFEHSNTLFTANLPYIKAEDWKNMSPDTQFEPEIALFGGSETGFELYEKLFSHFLEHGIRGILLIEFGFDQREVAEEILQRYPWKYEFFADYAGIERFAEIRI